MSLCFFVSFSLLNIWILVLSSAPTGIWVEVCLSCLSTMGGGFLTCFIFFSCSSSFWFASNLRNEVSPNLLVWYTMALVYVLARIKSLGRPFI